jgi:hypothetical protein
VCVCVCVSLVTILSQSYPEFWDNQRTVFTSVACAESEGCFAGEALPLNLVRRKRSCTSSESQNRLSSLSSKNVQARFPKHGAAMHF